MSSPTLTRRAAAFAVAVAALLVPAACAADTEPTPSAAGGNPGTTAGAQPTSTTTFPLTVRNCGEDVTIQKRPEKVLAQGGSGIDFTIAVGAVDKITHRSTQEKLPLVGEQTKVKDVPVLYDGFEPSREVLLGSGIDTIVGPYLYSVERSQLAEDGIAFLVPEHNCGPDSGQGTREPYESLNAIDATYRTLEMLGKVFGTEAAAAATVTDMKARISAVEDDFDPGLFKTALYMLIGGDEGSVVTGFPKPTLYQDYLDILGLQNVLTEQDEPYIKINPERLIDLDPDLMIIAAVGDLANKTVDEQIAWVKAIPGVSDMKAIKTDSFAVVEANNADPRLDEALEDLARKISALADR